MDDYRLLASGLLSEEKRAALKDFLCNPIILAACRPSEHAYGFVGQLVMATRDWEIPHLRRGGSPSGHLLAICSSQVSRSCFRGITSLLGSLGTSALYTLLRIGREFERLNFSFRDTVATRDSVDMVRLVSGILDNQAITDLLFTEAPR